MNPSDVSEQMKWLEKEAPRYTSYPSALYFKPMSSDIQKNSLERFDLNQSVALYIHIPFCKQLCWFCGCHTKVAHHYSPIASYVRVLIREIERIRQSVSGKIKLHSIHFGGGSPGLLSGDDLETLFKTIHAVFDVQPDAEIAMELDPRQITPDKIKTLKRLCFNRISLGVQDTNKTVQAAIHRIQSVEKVRECCDLLRQEGIQAINMDLIYGLPFQTMESIEQTIHHVCSLAPTRIAYYSFAHVPSVKKHQKLIIKNHLPTVQEKGAIYLHAAKRYAENGYFPLGIDHFAKPEDDCYKGFHQKALRRNFMGYTTQPNDFVLGVGASAISHLGDGISQNSVNDAEYKLKIEDGCFATARGWVFTPEDHLRKAVINELMCYFSVDLSRLLTQFKYPIDYFDAQLQLLTPFCETGVISIVNREITFHSPLRMIVRSVCSVFDQYHLTLSKEKYLNIS